MLALKAGRSQRSEVQCHLVAQGRGGRTCGHRGQGLQGDPGFKAHRQQCVGGLGQRRGQREPQSLQVGGNQDLGDTPAKRQRQRVGRAARGAAGQLRKHAQLPCLLKPLGGGRALRPQLYGGLDGTGTGGQGAHSALQAQVAPQRARLHAVHRKTGVGKLHSAAGA